VWREETYSDSRKSLPKSAVGKINPKERMRKGERWIGTRGMEERWRGDFMISTPNPRGEKKMETFGRETKIRKESSRR
jgi:hypothetical protein